MDGTAIAAIFVGIAGVLTAWSQVRVQRVNASGAELRAYRKEYKRVETQMLGIRRWAIKMEELLRQHSVPGIPRRPAHFDLDWGREPDDAEESPKRLKLVGR